VVLLGRLDMSAGAWCSAQVCGLCKAARKGQQRPQRSSAPGGNRPERSGGGGGSAAHLLGPYVWRQVPHKLHKRQRGPAGAKERVSELGGGCTSWRTALGGQGHQVRTASAGPGHKRGWLGRQAWGFHCKATLQGRPGHRRSVQPPTLEGEGRGRRNAGRRANRRHRRSRRLGRSVRRCH
jgi:hypothetical protein